MNLIDKVLDLQSAHILGFDGLVESEYPKDTLLCAHRFIKALRCGDRYWIEMLKDKVINMVCVYKSIKYNQDWFAQKRIDKIDEDNLIHIYGKCLKYGRSDWYVKLEESIKENKKFTLESIKGYFYYIHKITPSDDLSSNNLFLASYLTSSLFTIENGNLTFLSGGLNFDVEFIKSKFDVDVLKRALNHDVLNYMATNISSFVTSVLKVATIYHGELGPPLNLDRNHVDLIKSLYLKPFNQLDPLLVESVRTFARDHNNYYHIIRVILKHSTNTLGIKNIIRCVLTDRDIDINDSIIEMLASLTLIRRTYELTPGVFEETILEYLDMNENELKALLPSETQTSDRWELLSLLVQAL